MTAIVSHIAATIVVEHEAAKEAFAFVNVRYEAREVACEENLPSE
jgi:hypothetical protein